ncbi:MULTISPECIES: YgdI/YgdR family lipoprotein [Pseudomonas]|uniref:YgdI/YgdR family lipoprotein n=1 Tax=Pseudomonas soli TaxID=1306993 RepID=A0AAJ5MKT3_9PSED|nr:MULTISPECIES: YgdI/YgdR family lipoprotein [Pseudomonas]MCO7520308.1 YgdI/YgdR family lipoprotein [Pseudomonas sp. 1]MCO7542452.1 YgdI/YgdR family lipoprotein [Pseudomonas sp. VA159-2]UXZ45575.1 YgdI/YgdR family lipoprotein [Pseudomonas soli]
MFHRHWRGTLLALVCAFALAGCAGNYKFDDDSYRPLGDPQALNRDK